jgi:hypothetical protein
VRPLSPASLVVLLALLGRSGSAHATDDVLKDRRGAGREAYRSKQHGAVELRLGPYRPDVDAEFGGAATPFENIYGTGETVMFGIEGDWQALRIPHFGTLGPGLQVSFAQFSQYALLESDPSQRSAQPTNIWFVPFSLLAVLRIDVLSRELKVPLVPYLKFGGTLTLWEARDGVGNAVYGSGDDAIAGQGISTGFTGAAGLAILLNPIAPQAALDLDNGTGVNNAYVFGEWYVSKVSSFESGLDTGTSTWLAGIALEF